MIMLALNQEADFTLQILVCREGAHDAFQGGGPGGDCGGVWEVEGGWFLVLGLGLCLGVGVGDVWGWG